MLVTGMGWGRWGAIVALCALAACGKDSQAPVDTGPKPSELRLRPPSVDLKQLDSLQIIPSVLDDKGVLISGVAVTFQSADPSIVTVSNVGVITSVGPAGATSVTVKALTLTATVPVTVGLVATKLTLAPNPVALPQKQSVTLTARLLDKVDKPIPGAAITYASSDTLLVRIGADGVATSVGPAGQVTITARSGEFFATTTIAVTQVPTTIVASPGKVRLGRTRSQQVGSQVMDAVGERIPGLTTFSYTSLNPTLITVSSTGVVTSVGPLGQGSIRIAATGTSLTLEVPVEVLSTTSPAGTSVPTTYPVPHMYGVAFAGGDTLVGLSVANTAVSLNLVSGQFRQVPIAELALAIAYDPTRNTTYIGEQGGKIRQIEHSRGVASELLTLPQGNDILSFAVSADGRFLYIGGSGKIHTLELATKSLSTFGANVFALHLTLHPDGRRAYASGNGSLIEADLVAGTTRSLPAGGGGYWQANAITSDGKILWVASEYSGISRVDLSTGVATFVSTTCGPWGLAITRDDRFVYGACSGSGTVLVLDAVTGAEVKRHTGLGEVRRVAMSVDGSLAAVASSAGLLLFR